MSNRRSFGWFIRVAIALVLGLATAAVGTGAASAAPAPASAELELVKPEVHISADGQLTVTTTTDAGKGAPPRVETVCTGAITPPIQDPGQPSTMVAFYSVSCDALVQSIVIVAGIFTAGGGIVGGADVPLVGPVGVSTEIRRPCLNGNFFTQYFVQIRFLNGFPPIISATVTSDVATVTC